MNLGLNKCQGQCYDGASTISGPRSGVAKQLRDEEPCALYLHCHGHALNLAAGDTVKRCKHTKDALDVAYVVSKLVKYSPKRIAELEKLREELALDSPGFRVLCPTHWTVHAASLKSLLSNYAALQQVWETTKDPTSDPTIKGRHIGVQFQFKTFSFFFGVNLAELVLRYTDNLSKTLQSTSLSASEGDHIAAMKVKTLKSLRTDDHFTAFGGLVIKAQQDVDVCDPELPGRRKAPKRYNDGAPADFPNDCQAHYWQSYFEAIDLVVNATEDRFDQPDFSSYRKLEEVFMHTICGKSTQESFDFVTKFCRADFDSTQLQLHLDIVQTMFPSQLKAPSLSFHIVRKYIGGLSEAKHALISEVVTLLKLILVLPSTNAVS